MFSYNQVSSVSTVRHEGIKMKEIIISGATGVGKTLYAEALSSAAESGGLSVLISDHELFANDHQYPKTLKKIKEMHKSSNVDLSILVVNDHSSSLKVDFGGAVPYNLACILFPFSSGIVQ